LCSRGAVSDMHSVLLRLHRRHMSTNSMKRRVPPAVPPATRTIMVESTPLEGGASGGDSASSGDGREGSSEGDDGGGGATTIGTGTACWTVGAAVPVTVTPSVRERAELEVAARVVAAAAMSVTAVPLPSPVFGIVSSASIWTLPAATRSSRKHTGSKQPSEARRVDARRA